MKNELIDVVRKMWHTIPLEQRKYARRHIHPALLSRINRLVPKSPGPDDETALPRESTSPTLGLLKSKDEINLGKLTVVIPVYNVENYLDECLSSVINQSYRNLQIILVDDGSKDRSVAIARGYARLDPRITLIEKENAGLGAARNTGTSMATGKYLAFADSDDIIPKNAYESMILSLNMSGSEFAVGSINRLQGKTRSVPRWAQTVHSENKYGITLEEHPEILTNVFAWNKIFLKSFWDKHDFNFPEGIVYEDQETTARAYNVAQGFDVLSAVVYDWRIRDDRTSITQQKNNIKDLNDRLLVISRLNSYMANNASLKVYTTWLRKIFADDLPLYYSQIPRVDEDYWELLQSSVSDILDLVKIDFSHELDVHSRILLNLLITNSRDDFEKVIISLSDHGRTFPLIVNENSFEAVPAYGDLLGEKLSKELCFVSPERLRIESQLTHISQYEGILKLGGHAYLEGVDSNYTKNNMSLVIVNESTGDRFPVKHSEMVWPAIDRDSDDRWTSYASSGFSVELDINEFRRHSLALGPEDLWSLRVEFKLAGHCYSSYLEKRALILAAASMPIFPVEDGRRVVCQFSSQNGLYFRHITLKRIALGASLEGRNLAIKVRVPEGETPTHLLVENSKCRIVETSKRVTQDGQFYVLKIVLPDLPYSVSRSQDYLWKVRIETQDKKRHHLAWHGDTESVFQTSNSDDSPRIGTSLHGYLEVHERVASIVVDECQVDAQTSVLQIRGKANIANSDKTYLVLPRLVLANGRNVIRASRISAEGSEGNFLAEFSLLGSPWGDKSLAQESGSYTLRSLVTPSEDIQDASWVPVSLSFEKNLPLEFQFAELNVGITRTPKAGALAVKLGPPFTEEERGKFRQNNLQLEIPRFNASPLKENSVLFESFAGKTVADSGLGIFNEMIQRGDDRKKYWSVRDKSVPVPDGAIPLVMYSREWYEVLHTAEYVVNNNNFPFYYRKTQGQKYLQTWHGTPLKKIANDIPTNTLSLSYIQLMRREALQWDYLLAQNNFAAEVLPRAFGYQGETLNLGYPRNDALVNGERSARILQLRKHLNIAEGKKIVLYAPTWRDNVKGANGQYNLVNNLDISVAAKALGDDYVFLLRGHHNVAGQRYTSVISNLIDVTSYSNVNDLFLLADILVTDYSSVMFDYCVTDKPLFFLAPDLEEYRDSTRGFYFDFESEAPGPIVANTSELAEEILLSNYANRYLDKYAAFKYKYASLDDGKASSRVYDRIWR